jgi:hypothetical protein
MILRSDDRKEKLKHSEKDPGSVQPTILLYYYMYCTVLYLLITGRCQQIFFVAIT